MNDTISRQKAIDLLKKWSDGYSYIEVETNSAIKAFEEMPSAQHEQLTDDDFETIRIHLNAYKERFCNQQRWEEAEEYQRIIDRFMAFASTQSERKKGEWEEIEVIPEAYDIAGVKTWASKMQCNQCGFTTFAIEGRFAQYDFCPHCGSKMNE